VVDAGEHDGAAGYCAAAVGRPLLLLAALTALVAAPAPAAAALRGDLERLARAGGLSGVHVADVGTGRTVASRASATPRPLASTTKLFTALAALDVLRPDRTLATTVLATAPVEPDGTVRGDLVLRGDGDPLFGGAQAGLLADRVAGAGVRRIAGSLVADESLFDPARGGPATGGAFDPELGGVLSALAYDRGRRDGTGPVLADPAPEAARRFDDLLEARGLVLPGRPRVGQAPPGAPVLAVVPSAPVRELVRRMLVDSDDFVAEMLAKRVGAEQAPPGTTAAGAAVARALAGPGDVRLVDGSGLGAANQAAPRVVTRLLRTLRARGARSLLARPGQGEQLRGRPISRAARSRCRLKTGTLPGTGVSGLSGLCGRFAFSLLTRTRDVAAAKRAEDAFVARLARG
jgi:D-alanyl-D-alanine carboxypeptidase/D-alanyl-D-alanine-endopeptidase (penicillin-binding protein 4)